MGKGPEVRESFLDRVKELMRSKEIERPELVKRLQGELFEEVREIVAGNRGDRARSIMVKLVGLNVIPSQFKGDHWMLSLKDKFDNCLNVVKAILNDGRRNSDPAYLIVGDILKVLSTEYDLKILFGDGPKLDECDLYSK